MIVYRASKDKFASVLSGEGAKLTGGRWNSKGISIIYTSGSRLLCMLEVAIHVGLTNIPNRYKLSTIEIPDSIKIKKLSKKSLPKTWDKNPPSLATKLIGDEFIKENKWLALKVPSALDSSSFNYLLNPFHPDFTKVKIIKKENLKIDERLLM